MGLKMNLREVRRQLLHILIGTATLLLIILDVLTPLGLFILIVVAGVLSILSKRHWVPFVSWLLDHFEREDDMNKFPGRGFIAFLVGVLLAIKLFEPGVAYASIMVLTLGDTVSTLFGIHVGRIRNPINGNKSIEGNLMGGLAGFLGAMLFVEPWLALAGSFGAMAVETIQVRMNESIVDDNIIVPLACGAIILLVRAQLGLIY